LRAGSRRFWVAVHDRLLRCEKPQS